MSKEKEDLAVDSDFIIARQKSGDKIAQLLRVGAVYFRRDYYNDVDSDIAGYSQTIASYSLSEEDAFAVLLEWGWSVRESLGGITLPPCDSYAAACVAAASMKEEELK